MADLAELARTGDLDDTRVTNYLHGLDYPDLVALLNPPGIETRIHTTPGATVPDPEHKITAEAARMDRAARGRWVPGDPRPGLADEDPAVNAAMARCAAARWRRDRTFGDLARTAQHDARCGWCDYPTVELLRALDWSDHYARLIEAESYIWRRGHGAYRRDSGRAGTYENPAWATFAALPAKEQRYLVDRAVEASRANLTDDPAPTIAPRSDAPREHVPWCDMRADHGGDCPPMPDDKEDPHP